MEKILELAKKQCEAAEVFAVSSEETSVQFEANRLKNIQGKQSTTISLRVIKNGRIGYATASGKIDESKLVTMAVETAQFGTAAKFGLPLIQDYPSVKINDTAVPEVTTEQMIGIGEKLIAPLIKAAPEIVCQGGVGRGFINVEILNSSGGSAKYTKTLFSAGIEGTIIHDTDMLFVGDGENSCRPISDTTQIIKTILRQLEYAREQAAVPTKQMPVVFTPDGTASALIPSLMAAFNGKTVLEGASPIGDKLGEQVFDTGFSLDDDALVDYRPETRPWDDEGVPSQRTTLIDSGAVMNFYYDLQTAAKAGKQSTGNGSRDRGLPSPGPSSFIIGPGDITFEDMVSDIKEGLVIEYLMGAEQGNILGGDFSGNLLLGYKIENGKITGRVKNTMVSGNVYQVLKDIKLSSELKWVGGNLRAPYIFCPAVAVASK